MLETLKQSIEEHSILWILVSGLIGGFIGSFSKFVFEIWLSTRFRARRESLESISRYRHPLLRAADALDRRLENFIRHGIGNEWFENKNDDYYKLSTLYLFGNYFCWCLIVERLALTRHHLSHRSARRFNRGFYKVFKGLTSHSYLLNLTKSSDKVSRIVIPRLQLTAIGEQMAGTQPETWRGAEPDVIGYSDFQKKYRTCSDFREAFSKVEELFTNVNRKKSDKKLNLILVFATSLRRFIKELDPHNRDTAPRTIYYLQSMNRDVALAVWHDMWSWSFRSAVANKRRLPWTLEGRLRKSWKDYRHLWRQRKARLKKWGQKKKRV